MFEEIFELSSYLFTAYYLVAFVRIHFWNTGMWGPIFGWNLCLVLLMRPSSAQANFNTDVVPDINITISAAEFAFESGEVAYYKELTVPAGSISPVYIDFRNSSSGNAHRKAADTANLAFGILQVHACLNNISLSYNATLERGFHQTGSDLGLIVRNTQRPSILFIHNTIYRVDVQISIAFIPYNQSDPVPGGCSMELTMPEVPTLVLDVKADMTTVDTPLAATSKGRCDPAAVFSYTGYHRYMRRSDYSCRSYFDGIRSMMTATQLRQNGQLGIPHPIKSNRRTYVTVPGTGVVFATMVTLEQDGSLATYVPVYSVACSPLLWESNCDVFSSPVFFVLNAVLIVAGIIRAYLGPMLFCVGAAIDGFVLGAFVTFYVQCQWWPDHLMTAQEETILLCTMGGITGLVLAFVCCFFQAGAIVTLGVTNVIVGYLLATFSTSVVDTADMKSHVWWYQLIFMASILIVFLLLPPCFSLSGIIVTIAWGSFAIMQAFFFMLGTHSSYLVLNTFNSFRVNEFR